MCISKLIILYVFFLLSHSFFAQRLNRFNKHGERTGKWIVYIDDAKKIKSFEGKFRNGISKGKCYFYTNDGVLERREINRFKKMKTTFYYPNGKVKLKGNARIENLTDKVHYYFYGKWQSFNDSGILVKCQYYEKGELVKTEYLDKNNKINDSLIEVLNSIDKEFTLHNTILTDSINAHLKDKELRVKLQKELQFLDSISFSKITHIIDVFDYPSRAIAGESNNIPFYIISFAPVLIKEKYLNQLILAADRDDISWKSLAYFIDKLKVAKGEKQIYGTQGSYDKEFNYTMFPVIDPEKLNERRARVGLENID